jgi:GTP cyclohydrolase IB
MLMKKTKQSEMPDVASSSSSIINSRIDWVGMDQVVLPMSFNGEQVLVRANVHVNVLDPSAKGIHMSRLFLALEKNLLKKNLDVKLLRSLMTKLVDSQNGLSDAARLQLTWQQPVRRKALLSDNYGWKEYPMSVTFVKKGEIIEGKLAVQLFYSSTCPCSAALSRQLVQQAFKEKFSEGPLNFDEVSNWLGTKQVASPHSQRSRADIAMVFKGGQESLDFIKYINSIEDALKTPVQTAVKREDEQEFARLNGENLMFVEDALRRMKDAMSAFKEVRRFKIKASHFESLHQHDAVGTIVGP